MRYKTKIKKHNKSFIMQTPLLSTEVAVKEPEVNQLIENPEKSTGKATLFGSTFNIANNVMGAGFLSLPWAFKHSSVFPGAALLLLIAVLSVYSFVILAHCCEKSGLFVYRDMGKVFYIIIIIIGCIRRKIWNSPSSRLCMLYLWCLYIIYCYAW